MHHLAIMSALLTEQGVSNARVETPRAPPSPFPPYRGDMTPPTQAPAPDSVMLRMRFRMVPPVGFGIVTLSGMLLLMLPYAGARVPGAVLVLLGTALLAATFPRADRGLLINSWGITDTSTAIHQAIPWDQFVRVDPSLNGVAITVNDPSAILREVPAGVRWMARMNTAMMNRAIVIAAGPWGIDSDRVIRAIVEGAWHHDAPITRVWARQFADQQRTARTATAPQPIRRPPATPHGGSPTAPVDATGESPAQSLQERFGPR